MRRHPLTDGRWRLVGLLLVGPLLSTCVFAGSTPSALPPSTDVTITTAPGDMLAFDPAEPSVGAPGPIALTFRNGSSLPHNLTFTGGSSAATRSIVDPGTSDRLLLALSSGAYRFVCTIHDGMAGTLIVQPAGSPSVQSVSSIAR